MEGENIMTHLYIICWTTEDGETHRITTTDEQDADDVRQALNLLMWVESASVVPCDFEVR